MNTCMSRKWLKLLCLVFISVLILTAAGTSRPALADSKIQWADEDQDTLNDFWEKELMERFAPLVYLHHHEEHFPASVEWYLDRTWLGWGPNEESKHVQVDPVDTIYNLISQNHQYFDFSDLTLKFGYSGAVAQEAAGQTAFHVTDYFLESKSDSYYPGDRSSTYYNSSTKTGTWPVYVHILPTPEKIEDPSQPGTYVLSHPGMIDIQYWFFFPYNGAGGWTCEDSCNSGVDICCPALAGGSHEGDWEHLSVRVQADGLTIHSVYFSRHSGEGRWEYPAGFTTRSDGISSGPIAYSGHHSHALYTHAGRHTEGPWTPDFTNAGFKWNTGANLVNVGEKWHPMSPSGWIQYTGLWGELDEDTVANPNGPSGPAFKDVWDGGETPLLDSMVHSGPAIVTVPVQTQVVTGNIYNTFNLGSFVDTSSAGPWTVRVNWGDVIGSTFTTSSKTLTYSHKYVYNNPTAQEIVINYTAQVWVSNGYTGTADPASFNVEVHYPGDIPQAGPSYLVNIPGVGKDGLCGNNDCSLEEAIKAANDDGVDSTITFSPSYSEFITGESTITTPIIIDAQGKTIRSYSSGHRLFIVSSEGSLEIRSAILTGSIRLGDEGGGGITNAGRLTITGSTLQANQATEIAGAIYNTGTASISNSTLSSNSAVNAGGAIYNTGTLVISGSTLSGNTVGGGLFNRFFDGGAIYNTGTLTISNSTLSGNQVTSGSAPVMASEGGAISNIGTLTITNSTLSGNQAYTSGGAIFNETGGTTAIANSTLWDNHAGYIYSVHNIPAYQSGMGGAIFNNGELVIINGTLANNKAAGTCNPDEFILGSANLCNASPTSAAMIRNTILASTSPATISLGSSSISFDNPSCSLLDSRSLVSANNLSTDTSCGTPATTNLKLDTALKQNGAGTYTVALLAGSPAIDRGLPGTCQNDLLKCSGSGCSTTTTTWIDQRIYGRFADGNGDGYKYCDIGAYEYNASPGGSAPAPDMTPPQTRITLTPSSPDGANSWYRGPVTVKPEARDPGSGVIELRCALDPQAVPTAYGDLPEEICPFLAGAPVSADGPHALYMAAMDEVGNQSAVISTSFQIDATPPVLTCPAAGPFLLNSGEHPVGPAGVDASVSGLNEAASTLSGSVTSEAVGPKTLTFTAFDLAGNSASLACTYNVIYDFGGYYPPVAPMPALNTAEIGSAIPLKFSLAGDQGLDIFAAGFPVVQPVTCETLVPAGSTSPTKPAGKSGLSYDPLTGWYNYVWKTARGWAGTCQALTIQLIDGTQHTAYFQFK